MSYPEESLTYCTRCDLDVPADQFWRGKGSIISNRGGQARTWILYSLCPGCGRQMSVGLDGPWLYRLLYGWIWRLRYPATTPPEVDYVEEPVRRRAVGE
jgi:hypothetical protein